MASGTACSIRLVTVPLCPDLLRWTDIGPADTFRGRVVRLLLRPMRWWDPEG